MRAWLLGVGLSLLAPLLAAQVSLPHDEYLPADPFGQRQDKPEQVLFEVQRYSLTVGSELRPGGRPNQAEAGVWLLLEGRSLLAGSPVERARLHFVEGGAGLRAARLEDDANTLVITYPLSLLPVIRQQLDAPGADYVQGRFYGNGLIWADLHSAPQSGAR
ncbi:hypothetical protein BXT89_07170 [Halopseudomonas pachastrellae]|jgi:hypothetical protein|uniref:Uncharacterized protein n=1 Tax=Halopseudomonas pachastrellae TaxID=254161 RepID=A0A1S8DJH9_9GAMM|nr:hypothetical protein [Halopseudomonas pachastrellae]MAB42864.1 hypothetical protein [Pseudomonadales bacterium]MED5492308.1 hypothetical protein [Pseudomonadota bacterium]HCB44566.1 hypothetical protein [Pseudomonas sp.]MEB3733675.1 hypothetical protein [Halopseudomonas pachastrellae]MEE3159223.1 hypothetical protein [Pseudomonadota bacterium]|tara:strand:+ start:5502 stop:5984 length:483 start_codon:yes stop_codon:yes gene_type:complete